MTGVRKYSDEFKADAVIKFLQAKESGRTIMDLAKELGVSDALLHAWYASAKKKNKEGAKKKTKLDQRTQYPIELKQRAVAMMNTGMKAVDVAKELGIDGYLVNYWHRKGISRGAGQLGANLPTVQTTKPVNGIGGGGAITDALIYLRHAEREIMDMVRDGKIARPDQAHLLTLLALGCIQKAIAK